MVGDGLGEAVADADGEALGVAEGRGLTVGVALAEGVALAGGEALAEPDTLGVGDGEAARPACRGISGRALAVRKSKVFLKVDHLGLITYQD